MLNTRFLSPTRIALLSVIAVGGLLSNHAARAIVPDSTPAEATLPKETSAPKQVTSKSQSKVSPYAKINRQRAQDDAARATTVPPTAATHAARKGASGGARKN